MSSEEASIACAMACPCAGPNSSVRSTSMSSVPSSMSPPADFVRRLPMTGCKVIPEEVLVEHNSAGDGPATGRDSRYPRRGMAEDFTGFPLEAFDFWKGLEKNNNREWFQAHKEQYERSCREPMKALMSALLPQYGPSKVSRINRDMRFIRDRAPYKTHIAAGVGGSYVSLSKDGLYVGTGMYKPEPAALARLRAAIAADRSGKALATMVASLKRKGYKVDTHERVPSAPKGYTPDHPRIELLRMKDLFAGKMFAPAPWMATRKTLDRVIDVIEDVQPLYQWLRKHVGARSETS